MKRVILTVPQGLTFDMLTEEQQHAIKLVVGRYVNPMPGSVPFAGQQLVDALTADNFDPTTMGAYGISWPVLYTAAWDGESPEVYKLHPLDITEYRNYMPDVLDAEGNPTGEKLVTECHRWAGWPDGEFN